MLFHVTMEKDEDGYLHVGREDRQVSSRKEILED